jgi:hypothetical protein
MKVIIAGSRHYRNYHQFKALCEQYFQTLPPEIEIVSGGAPGTDAMAECYASEKGYPVKVFPADWNQFPRTAGHIRNSEMAAYGDALIAFWDGKSKGTESMIKAARRKYLAIKIIVLSN